MEGIVRIALGNRQEGLEILDTFIKHTEETIITPDPAENLRRRHARYNAEELKKDIDLHPENYFQNRQLESKHQFKITHI